MADFDEVLENVTETVENDLQEVDMGTMATMMANDLGQTELPAPSEEESKSIGAFGIAAIVAGVAGVGYAGYKVGKKIVARAKDSKLVRKLEQKKLAKAKDLVVKSGYVVRPAELPPDPEPEPEEAVQEPEKEE